MFQPNRMDETICNLSLLLGEYRGVEYREQLKERLLYFTKKEKADIARDLRREFESQFRRFELRQPTMAEAN